MVKGILGNDGNYIQANDEKRSQHMRKRPLHRYGNGRGQYDHLVMCTMSLDTLLTPVC